MAIKAIDWAKEQINKVKEKSKEFDGCNTKEDFKNFFRKKKESNNEGD